MSASDGTAPNDWLARRSGKKGPRSRTAALGPRERWWLAAALVAIVAWGFSGSWEYPAVESVEPLDGSIATPGAASPDSGRAAGEALFQANGCYACHALDRERRIGPGLGGIYGTTVELSDGSTIVVDEDYLVESILEPQARLVAGYDEAAMPSFEGLISAEDARALAAFIKGLD